MVDYRVRLHRVEPNKDVYQVVIYLRKTNSPLAWQTAFDLPLLHHEYHVIRIWEVPTQVLLSSPGLLPFLDFGQKENLLA